MEPPAGGPVFGFGFLSDYTTVGTPSLRSLQGRDAMPSMRHASVPWCEHSNSHPSQSARRMGHPPALVCQRDQKPGPPAPPGAELLSNVVDQLTSLFASEVLSMH